MAETSASKLSKRIHTDGSTHYKGATAPASAVEGDLWYDTSETSLKNYNGTSWIKVAADIPTLTSVTGTVYAGEASTLTLTGTNFLTANLVVNFLQASDGINADVTVTPASNTSATVSVSAAVYNNVTAGNVVTIKVTNSDNASSGNQTKTAVAIPSGGTISSSGGYRYHLFTSSGTFTNTFSQQVEYLAVAGGGSGGKSAFGGGGGAGGLLQGTSSTLSATGYSIVIGAGAPPNGNGDNTTGLGLTAVGGGQGGTYAGAGFAGGSGGGGGGDVTTSGGAGTAGQGNTGGQGYDPAPEVGGGGGGAGAVGGNGNASSGGLGGIGSQYSAWATATSTGDSGYYAGGGGGGVGRNDLGGISTQAAGGTGGGGLGGLSSYANVGAGPAALPTAGATNTGGGGGGGYDNNSGSGVNDTGGAAGGSGIFIIRYQL